MYSFGHKAEHPCDLNIYSKMSLKAVLSHLKCKPFADLTSVIQLLLVLFLIIFFLLTNIMQKLW